MKTQAVPLLALTIAAALPTDAAVPSGFVDNVVMPAAVPTGVAYEPGSGNAFVLQKGSGGTALVLRRAASGGNVTTALTVPCVDSAGERGLLGIAFDPDYLQSSATRWVYLYYTQSLSCAGTGSGSRNRVVRYKEAGGTLSGEDALLEGPTLTSATNHNAGTLRFSPDKTLFISMGDNATGFDSNPLSRDLSDLRGKLLRINRDGSIPADNPFVGQAGTRAEIWASGLRNPFRFSIDPTTGTPWIGDVGEAAWEELDRGVKGADYGWPCFEGDAPLRTCTPPLTLTPPVFVYGHSGTPFTGSTIIGGPVYRGGNFPASYQGRVFFADYVAGWIRSAVIDPGGNSLSDIQLFTGTAGNPVDLVQAPNGCLAYIDINGPNLHEICFTGGGNQAPVASASADVTSGPAPLLVHFTGSNSSDPDGDTLTYSWSFGDGQSSTSANPTHTYAAGTYSAVLTVNDGQGAANSTATAAPITITSGNSAPVPVIDAPADGTHYNAGDVIDYRGRASDPEDGTIPGSGLSWTIVFHHATHTHPFLGPIGGVAAGSFTIPTSGESATNVWFRIHLTATDSSSLSGTTYVDVIPNVATITLDASPAGQGLKVTANGVDTVAPTSFDSVVNFPRLISAPATQTVAGRRWSFLHWTDAAADSRTIATPAADTTYTAVFRCTSGCAGLPDQDGDGFTVADGDCDDNDPTVFPGAPELCDGKNNDCAGGVDDATCADYAGGDGVVNGLDLALLGRSFGLCSATSGSQPWAEADLTKDGCLDGNDLALLASVWGCRGATPVCH